VNPYKELAAVRGDKFFEADVVTVLPLQIVDC
jgi:hypothetical protein